MNELEQISNSLMEQELKETNKVINSILEPIDNNDISVLPEWVFKEHFLDYFRSPNKDLSSPILFKWFEISRGGYAEVKLVDENGNVVIIVPSVYPEIEISDKLEGIDFATMASEYQLESNRMQSAGENLLARKLNGMDKEVKVNIDENLAKWAQVFAYYDNNNNTLTTAETIKNTTSMQQPKIEDNINDFLQY